jgi:outer membrane lipoprotein-sorting protein
MNQSSTDQSDDQRPDDVLAQAIASLESEAIPPGPLACLVTATLRNLQLVAQPPATSLPLAPATFGMKLLMTAAGLLLAMGLAAVGLPLLDSTAPAFAGVFSQALEQVRQPQAMSYVQQMTVEGGQKPITTKEFIAADGRRRSEMAGNITISDSHGDVRLTLIEPTHTALVRQAKEDQGLNATKIFFDWLKHLKDLGDKPDQELGQQEIDGKLVTGFVAKHGDRTFTMWIDNVTGEPVRIEYDSQAGGGPVHITASEFHFHQTLDNSLFNLDPPKGYEVFGKPADGKIEPTAGLQLAWAREGAWSGVARSVGQPTVFALEQGGRVTQLSDGDQVITTSEVGEDAVSLRAASLLAGQRGQLLTFRLWGPSVEAHAADGKQLWSYARQGADDDAWRVDDVWPADLDGDGLDETIVGYHGNAGLHVLDPKGQMLWKAADRQNVWHVTAGDVEGDTRPEVLATSSAGTVSVFDSKGKHLRDIEPGFYVQLVQVWQQREVAGQRLEAATAGRKTLMQLLREEELQISLVQQRLQSKTVIALTEGAIEAEFAKDPQIADLTAQVSELKLAIKTENARTTRSRFSTKNLQRQLTQLQEQIEQRKHELQRALVAQSTGNDVGSLAEVDAEATLPLLEIELDSIRQNLESTNKQLDKQLQDFQKLDRDTSDLENQESQLDDLRSIIKRIGYQLSLWNIEMEAESRIQKRDRAVRPQGDNVPQKVVLAVLVGLLTAVVVSLLVGVSPWRSWTRAFVSAIVLGGLMAITAWVLVPVQYEAQALVQVGRTLPVVIQNAANGGLDEGAAYDIFKKTQMQWVKSEYVLRRAVRKPEMAALKTIQEHKEDPVGFLEGKLIVDYPGDGELMRVAIKGTHRDELATIVNTVIDAYYDEIVVGDQMARLSKRDLLARQLSRNKEEYREQSTKYHALASALGADSSQSAQLRKKLATQRLESLVASGDELERRRRDQELQIRLLRERKAKQDITRSILPLADQVGQTEYAKDPVIVNLTKQLDDMRSVFREQLALPRPASRNHLIIHKLKLQLSELEQKVEARKRVLQPEIVGHLVGEKDDSVPADGAEIGAMLSLLEAQRDGLEAKLTALNKNLEVEMQNADTLAALIIVAGSGEHKVPLAALDATGKTQWSLELPAAVANAATASDRPWLALSCRDGSVRVVDLLAGKEIAHLGDQGGGADLAWLSVDQGDPLLVIATDARLEAYRISTDQP